MQTDTGSQEDLATSLFRWSMVLPSSKELGGLYLGNYDNSQDTEFFKSENISVVLDLAGFYHEYPQEIYSKSISAIDYHGFDLSEVFEECFGFIHEHRVQGRNVFVHCQAGISRSPAIVIGYLIKTEGMDYEAAWAFVKKRRALINPNKGFVSQLVDYHKSIQEKKRELLTLKDLKEEIPADKEDKNRNDILIE